jgi:hypothetical protein
MSFHIPQCLPFKPTINISKRVSVSKTVDYTEFVPVNISIRISKFSPINNSIIVPKYFSICKSQYLSIIITNVSTFYYPIKLSFDDAKFSTK